MWEKLEKFQIVLMAVILAIGAVCAVKTATSNIVKDNIAVTGSAYKIVQSDSGMLEFNITARQSNRPAAYALVQKQLPEVVNYLKEKGFTDENIELKTSNGYNTYKYNSNGVSTNEIAYYTHTQPIVVKSNDVQKIKETSIDIQNLISKGIEINTFPPQYYYSKLSDMKVNLLKEATTDAKVRAAAMLNATHNRVGNIESVRMGVFQITPVDSTSVSDMGINDTTTIEKKVTAVANVVFRIK